MPPLQPPNQPQQAAQPAAQQAQGPQNNVGAVLGPLLQQVMDAVQGPGSAAPAIAQLVQVIESDPQLEQQVLQLVSQAVPGLLNAGGQQPAQPAQPPAAPQAQPQQQQQLGQAGVQPPAIGGLNQLVTRR